MSSPSREAPANPAILAPADPQAWLAAIVASSDDAIVGKRLDGTIVSWNAAATRLFGYTADEIIGRSVLTLIPPERHDEERMIVGHLTRGEGVDHFETVRRRKDGTLITVSLSVSPIRDAAGNVVGAAKIARDVSEQRGAIDRLARLQALTSALAGARTPGEVASVAVTEAQQATGARTGVLVLRANVLDAAASAEELVLVRHAGLAPEVAAEWERFSLAEDVPTAMATRVGEARWAESREELVSRFPRLRGPSVSANVAALATVPLFIGGQAVGVMAYAWLHPRAFPDEDREFFLALARQAAQALERSQLAEAEHRARNAAERMQALTAALSEAATRAAVGDVVMRYGVTALGAYAGVLALPTADGRELELLSSTGYPEEACMSAGRRWPLDAAIPIAEAARTREPVFVESPEAWGKRYLGGYAPKQSESAAWAALPVDAGDAAAGALLWSYDRPHRFESGERALMLAIARQCTQALERARLYESEQAARAAAERAAQRVSFLARASAALAGSLDVSATLDTVAHLAVPELADWAFVEMVDESGIPRPAAIHHSDEAKTRLAWEALTRYPLRAEYQHGTVQVARTGKSELVPEIPDAVLDHVAQDAEHRRLLTEIGFRSSVQVPLRARGEIVGVLTFVTAESGRRYGPDDLALAEEVAARASAALDNAALYEAERAARAAAEDAAEQAEEASSAKSDFLATMSHELRTPLNAVAGYVQLIELGIAGPVTPQQYEYLTRLRASSAHLLGLINDVLDLAKIDSGEFTVADETAQTANTVTEALAIVLPQAEARKIALTDATPRDSSLPYLGDPDRVRQILVNLLSNAVKFTEAGGRISVRVGQAADAAPGARVTGGGPWTYIAVRDTGIGIPPAMQAAVFDPFVQVESGKTRKRGGTGLGLAISRRLARLMGGDITLESIEGSGSTFTVWLQAPELAAATEGTAGGTPARGTRAISGRPRTSPARGIRRRSEQAETASRGLAPLGAALRRDLEALIEAWEARLRAEPAFAIARRLSSAQIEDHTLAFLGDLVQSLVIVDQTGGLDSELLHHGSAIHRVIAEWHGAQRYGIGFSEVQVAREYEVLIEVLSARLHRVQHADAEDVALAVGLLTRLIMHARAAAVHAFRAAAAKSSAAQSAGDD
ncbi:MAG TPA: GAF domain-containing protein [Gemmatimonadaceae bacterium]|nr:GAF domain-containing protein [Gemmatimonadaceae bacterium]